MTSSTSQPLAGKVGLVTGANTGIGRMTALGLAARGAHVVLASRSRGKAEELASEIHRAGGSAQVLEIDLASFASVRRAAAELTASGSLLHLLINNAGTAGFRGKTEDGFELAFGVNHLGHFLLTGLLRDRLVASAPARVVTVASAAHFGARGIDFDAVQRPTASLTGWPEYQASKLANVLFSAELGRRLAGTGVTTYAVHPGVVASDLWRRVPWPIRPALKLFMISNEEGATTTLHCATAPELSTQTSLYYERSAPRKPSRSARDPDLARELWEWSVTWTGAVDEPSES